MAEAMERELIFALRWLRERTGHDQDVLRAIGPTQQRPPTALRPGPYQALARVLLPAAPVRSAETGRTQMVVATP
jgi:hypothetical protein